MAPAPHNAGQGGLKGDAVGDVTSLIDDRYPGDGAEALAAALILLGGVLASWVAARALKRLLVLALPPATRDLEGHVGRAAGRPVVALILVQAVAAALVTLSALDEYHELVRRLWVVGSMVGALVLTWRVTGALMTWYAHRPGSATSILSPRSLPISRRIANVVIALTGAMLLLDEFGIAITPLVAGLGIGGLAVALAAQPIIANIFAGSYVLSDGSISIGDFIELEGGPAGWVEDIGLRATRMRTFDNNTVIIPNSTLAGATVTNFDSGDPNVGVAVIAGVAYEEHLETVQAVVLDVLAEIATVMPEVDSTYEPLVQFEALGESNMEFRMKLRAGNRRDAGSVRHAMITRVHARLAAEGITMSYPARRLLLEPGDTAGLERLTPPGSETREE